MNRQHLKLLAVQAQNWNNRVYEKDTHNRAYIAAISPDVTLSLLAQLWKSEALMREAHDKLDAQNGERGDEYSLCRFCHTRQYNAAVGIEHEPTCVIVRIRQALDGEVGTHDQAREFYKDGYTDALDRILRDDGSVLSLAVQRLIEDSHPTTSYADLGLLAMKAIRGVLEGEKK